MENAFVKFCRNWLTIVAAAITGLIGLLGLLGWLFGIEALTTYLSRGLTIKANTALCLLLLGLAMIALRRREKAGWKAVGFVFAAVVTLVGLATLLEHVGEFDFGIDQLIVREPPGALATTRPGRMGPPASLAFMLGGTALLLLDRGRGRWSQFLGCGVCLIASLPLIGYAYHIPPLYGISQYTGIASHTALALLVFGVGVVSLRQDTGVMATLCADDGGGAVARRMLLPALCLPFAFGWLRTVGERAGWIDPAVGRPLLVMSLTITMGCLVYWNARKISALEVAKRRGDRAAMEELAKAKALADEAREKAEAASRVKSEFIATLSHEMRTPLSAVMLRVSAFEQHTEFPAALRPDLEEMRKQLALETHLISDLLDLTRIERGALVLDQAECDLHQLLTDAVAMSSRPQTAAIALELRASRHAVWGDKTRLHQIFWNLLANAQKFTPEDGRIVVETADGDDGRIRVLVRDNGRGFGPEIGRRMFTAFEQGETRDARQRSGLGLGLSITRNLVTLHGGSITATSQGPGLGATFVVELPARAGVLPAPEAPAKSKRRIEPLRILVVEDHAPTLTILRRLLSSAGHQVTSASTAHDAINAANAGAFDVLLTDLGLPDATGLELMRSLGDRFVGRAVALSGYGTEDDLRATRAAGFCAHLVKPVELEAINRALEGIAGRAPGESAK